MERLPLMMLGIYTNIAYANPTIHSFLDFICIPSCKWIVHKIIKSILDTHIERLQFASAASRYKDLIILLLDWSFSNTVLHRWAANTSKVAKAGWSSGRSSAFLVSTTYGMMSTRSLSFQCSSDCHYASRATCQETSLLGGILWFCRDKSIGVGEACQML